MLGISDAPGWSEADRFLAQALTLHDASLCPCGCGGYADVTLEHDGYHEIKILQCDARAELDRYAKDNPEPEPGELRVPVFSP